MKIPPRQILLLCICWLTIHANENESEWMYTDEGTTQQSTDSSSQYPTDVTTAPTNVPEFSSVDDDVIELNVGGQRLTTLRSTLTAVPNSRLARRFAKGNESSEGSIYFYDYNPVQFEYLLDQLRAIKRIPQFQPYDLNIVAPNVDVQFNFSYMLDDLGLTAEHFLSPHVGVHLNLNIKSLVGWKECHRSTYNRPFDLKILTGTCKGGRLLVACHPTNNNDTLTLAGIGQYEHLFDQCIHNSVCITAKRNGIGFYQIPDRIWGFNGLPKNQANGMYSEYYDTFYDNNPCESSEALSQYGLCWSFQSRAGRIGGDRCGILKNLHNTKKWERIIYRTV